MKKVIKKSFSKTKAPLKDRIFGSKKNVVGSAKSTSNGKSIQFSSKVTNTIKNELSEYNKENPSKKINVNTAKAVVRRGMGAYSTSHRPTISDNKPNSRTAWGLARLNAFMRKKTQSPTANGVVKSKPIKKTYIQDNDLL